MSQRDTVANWLFSHFVSDTPEINFSQVLDLEEEVQERQRRICQIPQERRVDVVETSVLPTPCEFVVDDNQAYINNFDLSYLDMPNVVTNVPQPGHSLDAGYMSTQSFNEVHPVLPGHSRDVGYMSGQDTRSVPGHSRNSQYMPTQRGYGSRPVKIPDDNATSGSVNVGSTHCNDCPESYHPTQKGAGRLRKRPSLFTVARDGVRVYKKFNMQGTYYMLDIPPPEPGANTEHWLRALLNAVIQYFRLNSTLAVRPGDYVGLQLNNTCFVEKPVYVGLRRMDQLDADVIFEKILSIFDSNKDFFINGKMEIEFSHIQLPHGSGRIKKRLGQTNEEFIQGIPSFIKYDNHRGLYPNDEFCLPYAILLGKAALDRDTARLKSYTRSVQKLRDDALILCQEAGVNISPGGCSIAEVPKFQAILPGYQIVIFQSLEPRHVPYTNHDYYQKDNKINILLENGHYSAMRSLQACFASEYVCQDCHTRAPSRKKHKKCVYTCPCCLSRPPCIPLLFNEMIYCADCCRSFRGNECFNNHRTVRDHEHFSVCQRVKTCGGCRTGYFVDGNKPHVCGFFYCVTCEEQRPDDHQCYMPVYKTKREDESNVLYITYDFETQQNTLLDPAQPGKYKHLPNLCVLQMYCHTCQGDPDSISNCGDCGEKQRILFSTDCVRDLLSFITDKANERKPVEEESEEEGEPSRKRRKRVGGKKFKKIVAISHNMGGFDGQFILNYILKNSERYPTPKMIINGTRIIQMNLGFNVTFLDSLNYFHTALSKLPEMFGFEGSKGYYPHLFNTPENAGYIGPLVDKRYYSPESMSKKGRAEFETWYKSLPKDYVFDNDKELIEYCIQDVTILRKACMKFSSDFWEVNKIDPFLDSCTIAGACNKVFRSNYLMPDSMGVIPANGYRYRDNQSKIALKWLSLIEMRKRIEIQHAARSGEKYITGVGKVDGYHGASNTVFEFMGCFYHGCERCYPNQYLGKGYKQPGNDDDDDDAEPFYLKPRSVSNEDDERNQTMFIRRENTEQRCRLIRDMGYNLVVMKECDFRRGLRQDPDANSILKDLPILTNEPLNPREAFYGGRTNATKMYFKSDGITKMYYYDICSLYPFINKTAKCPINHPKVHIGDVCNTLPWQGMDGLMKVTVAPPRKLYNPVLPTRMHSKLMFFLCNTCAKTFKKCKCDHTDQERSITGTWVIDEVKLALSRGYEIVKIHEIWEYEVTQYDPITREGGVFVGYINRFLKIKAEASGWPKGCDTDKQKDDYINEFYEREGILLNKAEIRHNPALRQMAKDQLNSFWGRFGLRPDLVRTIIVDCYDSLVMKMLDPALEMDSVTPVNDDTLLLSYREKEENRSPDKTSNVVIAAFTTAYARMELYKYLDMLGPDRLYYFDTDSIFFVAKPGDPMPEVGPFLGQMTDELEKFGVGTYIIEFVSGGPKNYAFKAYTPSTGKTHTVVKVKGITLNDEISDIVNFDLIKKFVIASVTEELANVPTTEEEEETDNIPKRKSKEEREKEKEEKMKNSVTVGLHSIRRTNTAEVYSIRATKTYRVNYTKRKMVDNYDTLPYGY